MGPEGTKWERNLPPIVVSDLDQVVSMRGLLTVLIL